MEQFSVALTDGDASFDTIHLMRRQVPLFTAVKCAAAFSWRETLVSVALIKQAIVRVKNHLALFFSKH
jgi:hypothetical protein